MRLQGACHQGHSPLDLGAPIIAYKATHPEILVLENCPKVLRNSLLNLIQKVPKKMFEYFLLIVRSLIGSPPVFDFM